VLTGKDEGELGIEGGNMTVSEWKDAYISELNEFEKFCLSQYIYPVEMKFVSDWDELFENWKRSKGV
jgi:hypothetical protein